MAVRKYVAELPAKPEALQWGLDYSVAAADAAFGNAVTAHGLIRDDMHIGSGGHIGVLVIPAMLALAQRERLPGIALSRGIVAGYHMAANLGLAIRTGAKTHHFRPSGMIGAFGATAGAIAAMRPDEDAAASALGFAANFAAGLNEWPWSGGQEIYVHAGIAARNGLTAFDLSRTGLKASEQTLEGRDGMFAAFGAGPDANALFTQGLSNRSAILDVRHKPFAGCNYIQTPIGAALALRRRTGLQARDIDAIAVSTFSVAREYPGCDCAGPFESVQQSKMSIQYGVSAALLYGNVDEAAYSNFRDPGLTELLGRCSTVTDPDMEGAFPLTQPARVEVRLKNGAIISEALEDVPWLSDAEVEARFRKAAGSLGIMGVDQVVEMAHSLCDLPDCRILADLIVPGKS